MMSFSITCLVGAAVVGMLTLTRRYLLWSKYDDVESHYNLVRSGRALGMYCKDYDHQWHNPNTLSDGSANLFGSPPRFT